MTGQVSLFNSNPDLARQLDDFPSDLIAQYSLMPERTVTLAQLMQNKANREKEHWSALDDATKAHMLRLLHYLEYVCPNGAVTAKTSIEEVAYLLPVLSGIEGMPGFATLRQ